MYASYEPNRLSPAEWRVALALHSATCRLECSSIKIQRRYGMAARTALRDVDAHLYAAARHEERLAEERHAQVEQTAKLANPRRLTHDSSGFPMQSAGAFISSDLRGE